MMSVAEFHRKAIGVPFIEKGRDYDGWDCWGLVSRGWLDVMGVKLPEFTYKSVRDFKALAAHFDYRLTAGARKVEPHAMAIACIFKRGLTIHVGLVVPGRKILHVEEGIETCAEPVSDFRIEGFYVPADRCHASI